MGFSAAFGWFVMAPDDYQRLGQSIIATTLFVSNYLFWSQTGYFDTPAMEKPLLHTWSLAVEEQFYITFPLYLVLAARFFPRQRLAVTILAALASFSLSIWMVRRTPGAAFYFGPPRAWELLIGSLLAIGFAKYPATERVRNAVAALGILLIAAAVVGYSKDTRFPGIAALPPTIGAAFLIWSGTFGSTVVSRVLSTSPFVFVGKISYSLYLWHFSLLAFANYLSIKGPGEVEIAILVLVPSALRLSRGNISSSLYAGSAGKIWTGRSFSRLQRQRCACSSHLGRRSRFGKAFRRAWRRIALSFSPRVTNLPEVARSAGSSR